LSHSVRTTVAAKQYSSRKRTVFRLGILPSIGPVRLAPLLVRFAAEQPEIELKLVETPLPRLNHLLLGSNVDAAVVAYVVRHDKRFHYCRIYQERIVVVIPRGHRFEQCEVVCLRDLMSENLLFRTNCDMGDFLLQSCRKHGFEPRIIHRSAREDWVQTMVASGFGITVMPEFTHTHPATAARPLVDPDLVRQLSLVTVAGRPQERAVSALIRAIRAQHWQENRSDHNEPHALMLLSKMAGLAPDLDAILNVR
jgi:DNA-binding transcriptional LysR family regulator